MNKQAVRVANLGHDDMRSHLVLRDGHKSFLDNDPPLWVFLQGSIRPSDRTDMTAAYGVIVGLSSVAHVVHHFFGCGLKEGGAACARGSVAACRIAASEPFNGRFLRRALIRKRRRRSDDDGH